MLQVRNVTKWFGDVMVLDHVGFVLNRGDRAGLIGPNGCGKTTLLRILTGQLLPDEGSGDVFAHYSAINMEGYKTLKAGQPVRFQVEAGPKGLHAIAIEIRHVFPPLCRRSTDD